MPYAPEIFPGAAPLTALLAGGTLLRTSTVRDMESALAAHRPVDIYGIVVATAHPAVCALLTQAAMASLTGVEFGSIEDETPAGGMISTCRYFMPEDHPAQWVEVAVEWTPDLKFARDRMGTSANAPLVANSQRNESALVPGIGDEAVTGVTGVLVLRQGTVIVTVLSTLAQHTQGATRADSLNPHLMQETKIARAVLAKL